MNEPRANDPADHAPGGNRPPVLLADLPPKQSEGEPDAEEDAGGGEDPGPWEGERAQMNIGIERNFNHGERLHEAPRVARGSGLRASRSPAASRTTGPEW